MSDIDVLTVGGGPTGMMLALELATQNFSFRVIDKEPIRAPQPPRIAHDIVALGTIGTGARIFVNQKLAAELDLDDLGFDDTAFPLPLWISQADTEHFLDQALQRHGHSVERPVTAEKIEQDEKGATVLLCRPDGTEEQVLCEYIIGCDGAHGVVRRAANLAFAGSAYPQDFILADLHLDWNDYDSKRLTMFFGQGLLVGFPLSDGLFRLIAIKRGGLIKHEEEPTLADFQAFFDMMAPERGRLYDPVWMSRFRLHHRSVNAYRAGRLFVAGDAAHIHSPAGGQGMNTGMQDAVNLGWKLGSVLRGERDESLLDSYYAERRRVGEHLLRGTDRVFQFGSSGNPLFILLRNFLVPWILPWAFGDRGRRAKMFRFVSELGIRYRHSSIVGTASAYRGPLCGGDRAPDGTLQGPDGATSMLALCMGPRHHFIMFSGTGSVAVDDTALQRHAHGFLRACADWAQVHVILTQASLGSSGYLDEEGKLHSRYGFVEPGYVLVRPDGYVAHIGSLSVMDELLAWLNGYVAPLSLQK